VDGLSVVGAVVDAGITAAEVTAAEVTAAEVTAAACAADGMSRGAFGTFVPEGYASAPFVDVRS
jgi:2-keto-3-deoxy-6-phosphogluconate aldolase